MHEIGVVADIRIHVITEPNNSQFYFKNIYEQLIKNFLHTVADYLYGSKLELNQLKYNYMLLITFL